MRAAWALAGALALGAGIPLGWGELILLGVDVPVQESSGWAAWAAGIAAVVGAIAAVVMLARLPGAGGAVAVVAGLAGVAAVGALAAYALALGGAAGDALVPPGGEHEVVAGVALGPGWYVSVIGAVVMTVAAVMAALSPRVATAR